MSTVHHPRSRRRQNRRAPADLSLRPSTRHLAGQATDGRHHHGSGATSQRYRQHSRSCHQSGKADGHQRDSDRYVHQDIALHFCHQATDGAYSIRSSTRGFHRAFSPRNSPSSLSSNPSPYHRAAPMLWQQQRTVPDADKEISDSKDRVHKGERRDDARP